MLVLILIAACGRTPAATAPGGPATATAAKPGDPAKPATPARKLTPRVPRPPASNQEVQDDLCPAGHTTPDGCDVCLPDLTTPGHWKLGERTEGSFTAKAANEAVAPIVSTECPSQADAFPPGVLVGRTGPHWSLIRYEPSEPLDGCHRLPGADGRDRLVCEGESSDHGVPVATLALLDVGAATPSVVTLARVSDGVECAPPILDAELGPVHIADIDHDAHPDVWAVVDEKIRLSCDYADHPGPQERVPLVFLYDGTSLTPTPKTRREISRLPVTTAPSQTP